MNRVTPKSPDEVREILPAYDTIEASFGFVPTSMHVMAHRPPILEGFTQMAGAILGPGVVDAGLKQLVAHVVSRTTGLSLLPSAYGASGAQPGSGRSEAAGGLGVRDVTTGSRRRNGRRWRWRASPR